jgi:hypothetical protein
MDDHRPEAEAKMRQSLGLSEGSRPPVADDLERLARQAIRSQAAARDYVERQLVRAEQTIQDLHTKLHAVRREKATAVEAVGAAHAAQARAEHGRRAAEAALINEKSVSDRAQRNAREAWATVQDLRTKLAQADQTGETLQTQLAQARQAQITAEQESTAAPAPAAIREIANAAADEPLKRRRGRPPGKRDACAPPRPALKTRNTYAADQEPVQWWTDGWTPRA